MAANQFAFPPARKFRIGHQVSAGNPAACDDQRVLFAVVTDQVGTQSPSIVLRARVRRKQYAARYPQPAGGVWNHQRRSAATMPRNAYNARNMELISAYQFQRLRELPLLREKLLQRARALGLKGTVLIAPEGINFSLGGSSEAVTEWLAWLDAECGLDALVTNRHTVGAVPFLRLKVRVRPEIITFDPDLDPGAARTGQALAPEQWHQLLSAAEVQLVDTRNDYEFEIGTFHQACNPGIERFTEFADWALEHLDRERPVAMFCTGGVRCEKASAWLLAQGFEQVYHLRGGILAYLEAYAGQPSLWEGECFVFDDRVSVDHALEPSGRPVCAGCRRPHADLPADGMPPIKPPGECGLCGQQFEPTRLAGIRERVRQIALARGRGESHLGPQSAKVSVELGE